MFLDLWIRSTHWSMVFIWSSFSRWVINNDEKRGVLAMLDISMPSDMNLHKIRQSSNSSRFGGSLLISNEGIIWDKSWWGVLGSDEEDEEEESDDVLGRFDSSSFELIIAVWVVGVVEVVLLALLLSSNSKSLRVVVTIKSSSLPRLVWASDSISADGSSLLRLIGSSK